MEKQKEIRLNIKIDEKLKADVYATAEYYGLSGASYVKMVLKDAVRKHKAEVNKNESIN